MSLEPSALLVKRGMEEASEVQCLFSSFISVLLIFLPNPPPLSLLFSSLFLIHTDPFNLFILILRSAAPHTTEL